MSRIDILLAILAATGNWLDTHNGAVTAVATVLIALYTVVLARVTNRQARLTSRSLKIAEIALTGYERPWLVIDNVKIEWRGTPTQTPTQGVIGTGVLNDWLITLTVSQVAEIQ